MTMHSYTELQCLCGEKYRFEAWRGTYQCPKCKRVIEYDFRPGQPEPKEKPQPWKKGDAK